MKKVHNLLALVLFFMLTLTSCLKKTETDYPPTVYLNGKLYNISSIKVEEKNLEKQIGKVETLVNKMPKNNGETNHYEFKNKKIYKIQDSSKEDELAIAFKDVYVKIVSYPQN